MKRKGREYWERIVADFEREEQTQQAFCDERGIKLATLQYWLYRIRRERAAAGANITEAAAERGRLFEHFFQIEKMEAIRRLAGGIANDINNILTVITGLTSILRSECEGEDPRLADFEDILAACRKGHGLTRNLLNLAGGSVDAWEPVMVKDVVEDAVDVATALLPAQVSVSAQLADDLGTVRGDPGQITHVLLHLVSNAADAVGDDGAVSVTSRNVEVSDARASQLRIDPGQYVQLEVVDSGGGMDRETLRRALEPFFTTKSDGEGLGLPLAYSIIRNHKGALVLDSEPEQGTKVTVVLPRAQPAAAPAEATAPEGHRRATLLLVDNEALVLRTCGRLLERLGYRVLRADSGRAAIDTCHEEGDEIDLVILDLNMPLMSGREVLARLNRSFPALPVLVTSGDVMQAPREALDRGAVGFLQKPYDLRQAQAAIEQALSGRAER